MNNKIRGHRPSLKTTEIRLLNTRLELKVPFTSFKIKRGQLICHGTYNREHNLITTEVYSEFITIISK